MMKLRINPVVAEDLKNIKEYIARDNEGMVVKTYPRNLCSNREYTAISVLGVDLAKKVSFRTDYK